MDLHTVETLRPARSREDLALARGEAFLAGGTWLFSEPQRGVTGLVDLTTMDWEPWTVTPQGLSISATCTIARLLAHPGPTGWAAGGLFQQCADALVMSFKIWNTATVGGNLCLALPAGAMISLTAALDAEVVVWTPDGGQRREAVASFVTGPATTTLQPGEVLRAVEIPMAALHSRTEMRRASLTALGRSSSVVIGRIEDDRRFVLTVTAATSRPHVLRFGASPSDDEVAAAIDRIDDWYDDPHGAPDWRADVTRGLALDICAALRP